MKRKYHKLTQMPKPDAYEDFPKEMDFKDDKILVELRPENGPNGEPGGDYWPLLRLRGIESFKITRDGNTTTIQFTSPETAVYADDWERPADYKYRNNRWLEEEVKRGSIAPPKAIGHAVQSLT